MRLPCSCAVPILQSPPGKSASLPLVVKMIKDGDDRSLVYDSSCFRVVFLDSAIVHCKIV